MCWPISWLYWCLHHFALTCTLLWPGKHKVYLLLAIALKLKFHINAMHTSLWYSIGDMHSTPRQETRDMFCISLSDPVITNSPDTMKPLASTTNGLSKFIVVQECPLLPLLSSVWCLPLLPLSGALLVLFLSFLCRGGALAFGAPCRRFPLFQNASQVEVNSCLTEICGKPKGKSVPPRIL